MGSGKSTVGKLLSEHLNLDFIDFDRELEEEQGKTIEEMFDLYGEDQFRKLEHEQLKKLLSKENTVISLGGGTPCFYNNMELINKNGTSVYLEQDADTLAKRLLKIKNKRPLIRDLAEIELKYFIETNLEQRLPYYSKAHHTVPAKDLSPERLSQIIGEILKKGKKGS